MADTEFARTALEVTRQWAVNELKAARVRVTNLRCGGEAYNTAISAVEDLSRLVDGISYMLGEKKHDFSVPEAPPVDPTDPNAEQIVYTETPASDPEPEPEPTDDRPIPKLEDVRGKCGEAKKAGVDIKGILNELGYKNLSSVDSKDYNILLDKVAAALEEIG